MFLFGKKRKPSEGEEQTTGRLPGKPLFDAEQNPTVMKVDDVFNFGWLVGTVWAGVIVNAPICSDDRLTVLDCNGAVVYTNVEIKEIQSHRKTLKLANPGEEVGICPKDDSLVVKQGYLLKKQS